MSIYVRGNILFLQKCSSCVFTHTHTCETLCKTFKHLFPFLGLLGVILGSASLGHQYLYLLRQCIGPPQNLLSAVTPGTTLHFWSPFPHAQGWAEAVCHMVFTNTLTNPISLVRGHFISVVSTVIKAELERSSLGKHLVLPRSTTVIQEQGHFGLSVCACLCVPGIHLCSSPILQSLILQVYAMAQAFYGNSERIQTEFLMLPRRLPKPKQELRCLKSSFKQIFLLILETLEKDFLIYFIINSS